MRKSDRSAKPAELLSIPKERKKSDLIDWTKPAKANKRQKLQADAQPRPSLLSHASTAREADAPANGPERVQNRSAGRPSFHLSHLPNAILRPFWPDPQFMDIPLRQNSHQRIQRHSTAYIPAACDADALRPNGNDGCEAAALTEKSAGPSEAPPAAGASIQSAAPDGNRDVHSSDLPHTYALQCTHRARGRGIQFAQLPKWSRPLRNWLLCSRSHSL